MDPASLQGAVFSVTSNSTTVSVYHEVCAAMDCPAGPFAAPSIVIDRKASLSVACGPERVLEVLQHLVH